MYKTKVQELCQRRAWTLPEYEMARDGPDHNPRFTCTVTVNGMSFTSPSPTRNAKQAQNAAAMLAFQHFSQQQIPNPSASSSSLPQPTLLLSGVPAFPQPSLCVPTTPPSGSPIPGTDADNNLPANGVSHPKSEACQTSQIRSPVTAVGDITSVDMSHLYKNQLQSYTQKRNINLPVYSPEWEGPPHAMRFKCKVTVDGQTYESPRFYSTLKDAEHAAAEVALMSLSPGGVEEDHSGLFKNLLQELVQKEGLGLPIYSSDKSGEAHMPIFVATVEVGGELFTGQGAKSKKQSEMSAAKVAYLALKERKGKSGQSSLFTLSAHRGQDPKFSSDCLEEANVITGLQQHANPNSAVSPGLINQPNKDKGKLDQSFLFPFSAQQGEAPELSSGHSQSNPMTGLQHKANPKSLVSPSSVSRSQPNQPNIEKTKKRSSESEITDGCAGDSSLSSGKPATSLPDGTNVVLDTRNVPSTAVGSSSCRRKVIVYSRNTNVEIEEGGTLLPISDDKWVAYSYSG